MRLFLIAVLSAITFAAQASDTLFVQQPQYPILIERHDNILMLMRIDAKETGTLNALTLDLGNTPREQIKALKLYYGGTDARQDYGKRRMKPKAFPRLQLLLGEHRNATHSRLAHHFQHRFARGSGR